MARRRRVVIGLVGPIGAGKTTVGQLFERIGAELISADEIVHDLLRRESVRRRLERALDLKLPRGEGDLRRAVAERIFGDPDSRLRVEAILHPMVDSEIRERLGRSGARGVVLDVPLLLEAGMTGYCDSIVFVAAPRELRLERMREAREWSEQEVRARERAQWPAAAKEAASDRIIDNGSSLDETLDQVRRIWHDLFDGEEAENVRRTPHGKDERDETQEEDTPAGSAERGHRARRPRGPGGRTRRG